MGRVACSIGCGHVVELVGAGLNVFRSVWVNGVRLTAPEIPARLDVNILPTTIRVLSKKVGFVLDTIDSLNYRFFQLITLRSVAVVKSDSPLIKSLVVDTERGYVGSSDTSDRLNVTAESDVELVEEISISLLGSKDGLPMKSSVKLSIMACIEKDQLSTKSVVESSMFLFFLRLRW